MTMRAEPLLLAATFAVAGAGCALDEGQGFGTIEQATLSVRLQPGSNRDLGDRTVLTDLGYEVRLAQAALQVDRVSLQQLEGGSGESASFDPAQPPPGYTLCHGGHCHAEDGRLVDYAEVEAELAAASNAEFTSVVDMPCTDSFDLWDDSPVELTRFEPSRELPRAALSRLQLSLVKLTLSGTVAGGPPETGFGEQAAPLDVEIPLGVAIDRSIQFVIGEDEPGEFRVSVELVAHGTVLDGIDFASEAAGGAVLATEPGSPVGLALAGALLRSQVEARFE
jgi:hypothetical protein